MTKYCTLILVHQVMKRNCSEREDAMTHAADGYEMLMQFIVRQYRRGIRVGPHTHAYRALIV